MKKAGANTVVYAMLNINANLLKTYEQNPLGFLSGYKLCYILLVFSVNGYDDRQEWRPHRTMFCYPAIWE